jgi:hypothetical protein
MQELWAEFGQSARLDLGAVGVDLDDVGFTLENQGIAGVHEWFQHVLAALGSEARRSAIG